MRVWYIIAEFLSFSFCIYVPKQCSLYCHFRGFPSELVIVDVCICKLVYKISVLNRTWQLSKVKIGGMVLWTYLAFWFHHLVSLEIKDSSLIRTRRQMLKCICFSFFFDKCLCISFLCGMDWWYIFIKWCMETNENSLCGVVFLLDSGTRTALYDQVFSLTRFHLSWSTV